MKSNYTREGVSELLDELVQFCWKRFGVIEKTAQKYTDEFKKEKGLTPTLEEGWIKLEWLIDGDVDLFLCSNVGTDELTYVEDNYYRNGVILDCGAYDHLVQEIKDSRYTLSQATNEEVEAALIKEAKKRGFKEGVKFTQVDRGDYLYGFKKGSKNEKCGPSFARVTYPNGEDILLAGGFAVYGNGKWATIIEEPQVKELTIAELEKEYGCKVKIIK